MQKKIREGMKEREKKISERFVIEKNGGKKFVKAEQRGNEGTETRQTQYLPVCFLAYIYIYLTIT